MLGAEALLVFNPHLEIGSDHLQKQTFQLVAKTRYLSAQFIPYFKTGLWHSLAQHANQKAQEIALLIQKIPGLSLSYLVETNQIFFTCPASWLPLIEEETFCCPWDRNKNEIRLITSWTTSDQDVKDFEAILTKISQQRLSGAIING